MKKAISAAIVVASFSLQTPVLAAWWGGALEGLGKAGEESAQQWRQEALERQRHENEMKRLEREHQLDMERRAADRAREAERRAQSQREQQALQDERRRIEREREQLADERELQKVETAHPGWKTLINTVEFKDWKTKQPTSVQQLGMSDKSGDAILMIDLYKRDVAVQQATPKPAVPRKKQPQ